MIPANLASLPPGACYKTAMIKPLRNAALVIMLATPTMPGAIQAAALDQEQPPAAAAPQPAVVSWRINDARDLLTYVRNIGTEGLSPEAYGADRLAAAIDAGDRALVTPIATEIFLQLATDLSGGQVRGRSRVDWFMPDAGLNDAEIVAWLIEEDGELGQSPLDALRSGKKAHVRRIAQTLV